MRTARLRGPIRWKDSIPNDPRCDNPEVQAESTIFKWKPASHVRKDRLAGEIMLALAVAAMIPT
jgi:hypothetical protein